MANAETHPTSACPIWSKDRSAVIPAAIQIIRYIQFSAGQATLFTLLSTFTHAEYKALSGAKLHPQAAVRLTLDKIPQWII
jgi:hypothetical protein